MGFRDHILEEMPFYVEAVKALDGSKGAGWKLIESLICAPSYGLDPLHGKDDAPTAAWKLRVSAASLQASSWFEELPAPQPPSAIVMMLAPVAQAEADGFIARWRERLADW